MTEARGEANSRAILTANQVLAIRSAVFERGGLRRADLAKKYGVSEALIKRVRARLIWRHIP